MTQDSSSNQTQSDLVRQLDSMVSEGRNPDTVDIDTLPTLEVLKKLSAEDHKVAPAVRKVLPAIARAVEAIIAAFANDGRLIYIGAGTSGRLGVLDAVECPPTFGVSGDKVQGVIAGGEQAIYRAVEGAEDDTEQAEADLRHRQLSNKDVLVGLAASGRTPYVVSALTYARQAGATAVAVSCNPASEVLQAADIGICVAVGPEALTGSTRLKSGTAQKMVLNMLSTAAMIGSGKAYQNLMVDVNASNDKLYARAIRIVMQATDCDEPSARQALIETDYQVKLAILTILTGADKATAETVLAQRRGFLRQAVAQYQGDEHG